MKKYTKGSACVNYPSTVKRLEDYIKPKHTKGKPSKLRENSLLEKLAELEHKQWIRWSVEIAHNENISQKRMDRWFECWKDYKYLPEKVKNHDRKWARKAISLIEKEVLGAIPKKIITKGKIKRFYCEICNVSRPINLTEEEWKTHVHIFEFTNKQIDEIRQNIINIFRSKGVK